MHAPGAVGPGDQPRGGRSAVYLNDLAQRQMIAGRWERCGVVLGRGAVDVGVTEHRPADRRAPWARRG